MTSYTLRDIERLTGLSRAVVQGFIEAGFVAPARSDRNELRFSFQDLIVLRAAQDLAAVKVPTRTIKQSLARLRTDLPPSLPLSGIRISALGARVVVRQGSSRWQADSGQYLLDFDVAPNHGEVAFLEKPQQAPDARLDFDRAVELEQTDPEAAIAAYRAAISADPSFLAAYLNLGCLLHARGELVAAERLYRQGVAQIANEPLLHFNLGAVLEDLKHSNDAITQYERVLALDADFADAHYNLARLHEARGAQRDAIRHYASYRRLQK